MQEPTVEIHTLIIYLHVSPVIWDHEHPLILLFDDKSSRPNLPYKAQSSKDPVFVFCSLRGLAAGRRGC